MNDPIEATLRAQSEGTSNATRPFICLSYAQSLDGSIAAQPGKPYPISGRASLAMTHQLRAMHDSILIGIGTALADNPQLNVRLNEGDDPDPVILDSTLRLPPESRLLSSGRTTHIFCAKPIDNNRARRLSASGAQIHPTLQIDGRFLDFHNVLQKLQSLGYRSVMIEGGATVITQSLQEKIVDWIVITTAPLLLGGLHAPLSAVDGVELNPVQIKAEGTAMYGVDRVLWGRPMWEAG
jgi:GTP cyclohydrolase II